MTGTVLSPARARRAFLTLTVTRWFPVGLVVGIFALWPLERGLTVAQTMTALAFSGVAVVLLELPTSGVADALGRRPVLIAAAVVNIVAAVAMAMASSFWTFALAAFLMGVFRALDSGPLEAWFVDTVHTTEPGADVDGALSAHGTLLGVGMAAGALISGGLVWWHPIAGQSALLLPILVFLALNVVHLIAVVALMREPRTHVDATGARAALASAREAPQVVREGLGLLRRNTVLRCLVGVEVFWATGMVVFETFQPIRLAELLGSAEQAGVLMGPVASAGWGLFAVGSALAGLAATRIGVTRTAIVSRVLNGLGAVVMGLAVGPVALIAAYLLTYGLHGGNGPMHNALLHREARARNRATVLSMNSMVAMGAGTVAAPLLGVLAATASTQMAMMAGGAFSVLGAVLYLPALRHEQGRSAALAPPAPAE